MWSRARRKVVSVRLVVGRNQQIGQAKVNEFVDPTSKIEGMSELAVRRWSKITRVLGLLICISGLNGPYKKFPILV